MAGAEPTPDGAGDAAELDRRRLHARILRDFGRIALEELEIGPLLQRAASQAARATGVRHTKIMRYRPEEGDLLAEVGFGWRPGVIGRARFGTDAAAPPGRAFQTAEAVLIGDIRRDPGFRIHPVLAAHGIVSLLNVPISFDGQSWGVLEADSEEPDHFGEADVEFLETMAALVGAALQRAAATRQAEAAAAEAAVRAEWRALLLRELQHRGKNNLALVTAMLGRARRTLDMEAEARGAGLIGDLLQRVNAIALAQDRLSMVEEDAQGDGLATEIAGYLRALLGSLELSLDGSVTVESELESCLLPFDKAVALGLVVNELVTNAAKHAYPPDERGGPVRVVLRRDEARAEATLTVSDEGRGMVQAEVEARQASGGQGTDLLRHLARQLGAEIEHEAPERGSRTVVRFPLLS